MFHVQSSIELLYAINHFSFFIFTAVTFVSHRPDWPECRLETPIKSPSENQSCSSWRHRLINQCRARFDRSLSWRDCYDPDSQLV